MTTQLTTKVRETLDRIKYYGEKPNTAELLELLLQQLEELSENYQDAIDCAREEGFELALKVVVRKVLEDSTLKTRSDMIGATESLEITDNEPKK